MGFGVVGSVNDVVGAGVPVEVGGGTAIVRGRGDVGPTQAEAGATSEFA